MAEYTFLVVFITTPDQQVADYLSRILVETKTAACVNIIPGVSSIFHWEGAISEEEECLLIVKTPSAYFEDKLVPLVKEHHPYQVPEMIAFPIVRGSKDYLDWMKEETGFAA